MKWPWQIAAFQKSRDTWRDDGNVTRVTYRGSGNVAKVLYRDAFLYFILAISLVPSTLYLVHTVLRGSGEAHEVTVVNTRWLAPGRSGNYKARDIDDV